MIVTNSLMRRRDDVDLATFQQHWLHPHGTMTALLPGLRCYVQNHVEYVAGTNALARAVRIDGIPQLAFDTREDCVAGFSSPELKACNKDSESFIGAVSRVMTKIDSAADFKGPPGCIKQILLFVAPRTASASGAAARIRPEDLAKRLQGVRRLVQHEILEQAHAPGSKVPNLDVRVDGMCEVWLENTDAVMRNAALLDAEGSGVASFVMKVHSFV